MKLERLPSDSELNVLLSDYRRAELPRKRFDLWMNGFDPASAIRPASKPKRKVAFIIWIPAAAMFLAAIIGGSIFLKGSSTLDAPLIVSLDGEAETQVATQEYKKPFKIITAIRGQARFKTLGELVMLGPESEVFISQRPLRALSGDSGFRYRLEFGTVHIEHSDSLGAFIIETRFGSVVPVGTVLSMRVSPDSFALACLEGAVLFTPSGGGASMRLEAGNSITISGPGGAPINSSGDAVDFPGIRTGGPDAIPSLLPVPQRIPEAKTAIAAPARRALVASPWKKPQGLEKASRIEASGNTLAVFDEKGLSLFDSVKGSRRFTLELEEKPDVLLLDADVYMLFGTSLRCVDAQTGTEKWRTETGPASFSRLSLSRGVLALASADGRLYMLDPATGRSLGTIRDREGFGMYGTPLLIDDLIIVSNVDRTLVAHRADGSGKTWSFKADGKFVGDEPVLLGDGQTLLDGDASGNWYAIDKNSGTLSWRSSFKPPLGHRPEVFGNLVVYQDAIGIWLLGTTGKTERIDADLGVLLSCMMLDGKIALFGTEGVWMLDPLGVGYKSILLEAGNYRAAATFGGAAYTLGLDGAITSWKAGR